jgi:hypothetical protein
MVYFTFSGVLFVLSRLCLMSFFVASKVPLFPFYPIVYFIRVISIRFQFVFFTWFWSLFSPIPVTADLEALISPVCYWHIVKWRLLNYNKYQQIILLVITKFNQIKTDFTKKWTLYYFNSKITMFYQFANSCTIFSLTQNQYIYIYIYRVSTLEVYKNKCLYFCT